MVSPHQHVISHAQRTTLGEEGKNAIICIFVNFFVDFILWVFVH
jgi:hypothetical protein